MSQNWKSFNIDDLLEQRENTSGMFFSFLYFDIIIRFSDRKYFTRFIRKLVNHNFLHFGTY